MNNRPTYSYIDSLKGIAVCSVIMIHSGGSGLPFIAERIINLGDRGVQCFFLISSFLAYTSLENTFQSSPSFNFHKVISWWGKKILRLIPLYYLSILSSLLFLENHGNLYWLGSEGHVTLKNILAHLLLIHGFFPHYANSILGVEWYLGTLVIFYIMLPFIYKYINSLKKSIISFFISLILCLFIRKCLFLLIPAVDDSYIYECYIRTFCIFAQLPVLFMGIILFYLLKNIDIQIISARSRVLFSYALLLLSGIIIFQQAYTTPSPNSLFKFVLFGLIYSFIILSQYLYKCPLIDNVLFKTLGHFSYPIYLFHFLLLELYKKHMYLSTGNLAIDSCFRYIIIVISSLIIAFMLDRYFDKPINKWLNTIRKDN